MFSMAELIGVFRMKRLLLIIYCLFTSVSVFAKQPELIVLCYHSIEHDIVDKVDNDQFAVSTDNFIAHLNWLDSHGYNIVGFDDIVEANDGDKLLPEKSILLTFDDGYLNFYDVIYPVLKLYNYPAVFALVGNWISDPDVNVEAYGNKVLTHRDFLTEQQIQEMHDSGLIEFASHSYDMHKGIIANPQGNKIPAAIAREYNERTGKYESDIEQYQRIYQDLKNNSEFISRVTGKPPRIMVWPYGAYNQNNLAIADELGMPYNLSLSDKLPTLNNIQLIGRHLIIGNPDITDFQYSMTHLKQKEHKRIVHVDLDYVFDQDESQQERNLDSLVERILNLKVSTVYLQAFSDPDANGSAGQLYFPNRHLPMRANLFNRVAWQLKTRAEVDVYAWMPLLAFELPDKSLQQSLQVKTNGSINNNPGVYKRLSPFNQTSRNIIRDIYEDLAKHAVFDGVLFHDDAVLSDFEDTSDDAINVYTQEWQLPPNPMSYKNSPELFKKWSKLKTQYLIDFSLELANVLRRHQKQIKTARNVYAEVILNPESETWYAQHFENFIHSYDYTAIMAMPYMENASDSNQWLTTLANKIIHMPGVAEKTVFELQTVDWREQKPIPSETLVRHMTLLISAGARHIAYYPDDFLTNHPNFDLIKRGISTNSYPYDFP